MNRRNFLGRISKLGIGLPLLPFIGINESNSATIETTELVDNNLGFRPMVNDPNNMIEAVYFDIDRKTLGLYWKEDMVIESMEIENLKRPNDGSILLSIPNLEPIYIHIGMEYDIISIVNHTVGVIK